MNLHLQLKKELLRQFGKSCKLI